MSPQNYQTASYLEKVSAWSHDIYWLWKLWLTFTLYLYRKNLTDQLSESFERSRSVWLTLDQFGSLWISLAHFGSVWLTFEQDYIISEHGVRTASTVKFKLDKYLTLYFSAPCCMYTVWKRPKILLNSLSEKGLQSEFIRMQNIYALVYKWGLMTVFNRIFLWCTFHIVQLLINVMLFHFFQLWPLRKSLAMTCHTKIKTPRRIYRTLLPWSLSDSTGTQHQAWLCLCSTSFITHSELWSRLQFLMISECLVNCL